MPLRLTLRNHSSVPIEVDTAFGPSYGGTRIAEEPAADESEEDAKSE